MWENIIIYGTLALLKPTHYFITSLGGILMDSERLQNSGLKKLCFIWDGRASPDEFMRHPVTTLDVSQVRL